MKDLELCKMSDEKRITSKHTKTDNSRVVFCFHKVFKEIKKKILKEKIKNQSTEREKYFLNV